jgi:hypothetical protein
VHYLSMQFGRWHRQSKEMINVLVLSNYIWYCVIHSHKERVGI